MQSKKTDAVPIPSATVMLVRDGERGIEVLMMARGNAGSFASGTLVFPGGKLEPDDRSLAWASHVDPPCGPEAAYWIAAVRETFEEAGILLASRRGAERPLAEEAIVIREGHRDALLIRTRVFSDVVGQEDLTLSFDRMVPFAHWITPLTEPKRFETHFFLVEAPSGQSAQHDGRELVSGFWKMPAAILDEARTGNNQLLPPTELNLELLAESATVKEAMDGARRRRVVTVTPVSEPVPGGRKIKIPAEAGYRTREIFVGKPGGS